MRTDGTVLLPFEKQVLLGLQQCGLQDVYEPALLGVAVSGGADSVALLTALAHIYRESGPELQVITVNHHIRPAGQSDGDARYVAEYCDDLAAHGYRVRCTVCELGTAAVRTAAAGRGKGIEDAARELRYEAFRSFAADHDIPFICLAHTKNDQLETLLMRFLQGSAGMPAAGIPAVRDIFLRPLLLAERSDIESYLTSLGVTWRTDQTNFDNHYMRNRIRNRLVPFLNECVPGWQRAVLSGAEKQREDSAVLDSIADNSTWNRVPGHAGCVTMDAACFCGQSPAVRRRLLYRACVLCGADARLPYAVVRQVCAWNGAEPLNHEAAGIRIGVRQQKIFVEKQTKKATQCGFFAIITKSGAYTLPFGTVHVCGSTVRLVPDDGVETVYDAVPVPFCIRSRTDGDRIMTADGSMKLVNEIFADWHVAEQERDRVPLLQELRTPGQRIVCVCGGMLGYEDWIVK